MEHAPTLTLAAVEERKQQPGARASPFHGANAGSNPAGDANFSMTCKFLDLLHLSLALHSE